MDATATPGILALMSTMDPQAAEICRLQLEQAEDLLADIKVGRTRRRYSAAEIAAIEAERDGFKAGLQAYEAARDG